MKVSLLIVNLFLLTSFAFGGGRENIDHVSPDAYFNSIPDEIITFVRNDSILNRYLTINEIDRIDFVSKGVLNKGLSGVSEAKYLSFREQRSIINKLLKAKDVDPVIRLVVIDALIQFYFYTYYYNNSGPSGKEFPSEHKLFFDKLHISYRWHEFAGCNMYSHTYLLKLIKLKDSGNKWLKYYKSLYKKTKFDDWPKYIG
jgi:hypothetical protein